MSDTRPRDAAATASTLDQFAEIIGEEAALRLIAQFGGRRLYIPIEVSVTSDLVKLIGLPAATMLSRRFGGVSFDMPLERRERIILLSARGLPTREIAETVGCSERHVKAVRARYRELGGALFPLRQPAEIDDPNQITLFSPDHPNTEPTEE